MGYIIDFDMPKWIEQIYQIECKFSSSFK